MADGPKIRIGIDPALFVALGNAGDAVKAQRATVKALEKEVKQVAKAGQQVSKELSDKLAKAEKDLQKFEDLKGRATAGGGRGGGGSRGLSAGRESGGGLTAGSVKHELREARHLGAIGKGIASGNPEEILEGLKGLAGHGSALAIGIGGAIVAYKEYAAQKEDENKLRGTKYQSFYATREFENKYGLKIAENLAQSDAFRQRFIDKEKKKLNFVDKFWGEKLGKDGFIRETANFLGLTTREGDIEEKATEAMKKGQEEAGQHLEQALKFAELGDIGRAQKEFEAASKGAGVNLTAVGMASPTEMYLRADQVRRAKHLLARNERPRRLRIGQYE